MPYARVWKVLRKRWLGWKYSLEMDLEFWQLTDYQYKVRYVPLRNLYIVRGASTFFIHGITVNNSSRTKGIQACLSSHIDSSIYTDDNWQKDNTGDG